MIFLYLFYTFCKIGLFGFGGGYAMLSMIQGEVVTRYNWISASEFTSNSGWDTKANLEFLTEVLDQFNSAGIRTSVFVAADPEMVEYAVLNAGYNESWAIFGSCIATFAVVFPSFILMVIISRFFLKYQKHPVVEAVFKGLRPAVVGLLAAAALVLMNAENFGSYQIDLYQFIISIIIFLVTFIGTRKYKINPILMIIACGIAGLLLY